jgi:hypothetical protein
LFERIETAALGEAPREASERQFADASRAPAQFFPTLLRAANHFANRSPEGLWLERAAGEVLAKLPAGDLPVALTGDERRSFALGYAHERAKVLDRLVARRSSLPPSSTDSHER